MPDFAPHRDCETCPKCWTGKCQKCPKNRAELAEFRHGTEGKIHEMAVRIWHPRTKPPDYEAEPAKGVETKSGSVIPAEHTLQEGAGSLLVSIIPYPARRLAVLSSYPASFQVESAGTHLHHHPRNPAGPSDDLAQALAIPPIEPVLLSSHGSSELHESVAAALPCGSPETGSSPTEQVNTTRR